MQKALCSQDRKIGKTCPPNYHQPAEFWWITMWKTVYLKRITLEKPSKYLIFKHFSYPQFRNPVRLKIRTFYLIIVYIWEIMGTGV